MNSEMMPLTTNEMLLILEALKTVVSSPNISDEGCLIYMFEFGELVEHPLSKKFEFYEETEKEKCIGVFKSFIAFSQVFFSREPSKQDMNHFMDKN